MYYMYTYSTKIQNVDDLLLYIKEKLLYFHHYYVFQGTVSVSTNYIYD